MTRERRNRKEQVHLAWEYGNRVTGNERHQAIGRAGKSRLSWASMLSADYQNTTWSLAVVGTNAVVNIITFIWVPVNDL